MKNSNAAISVIVPVYNVENYISHCIDSICNQTISNIEIIIVNDGSTDSSPRIIDHFARNDSRIIVINQNNQGYGTAVNAGLDTSTGEYISIIESDDWIEANMLEILYLSRGSNINIIKSSFSKVYPDGKVVYMSMEGIKTNKEGLVNAADSLELMLFESSIWSALYRRAALEKNRIRMLETSGASYQDVVWKFATFSQLGPIKLVDLPLYNYRVLSTGSSSSKRDNYNAHFINYEVIKDNLSAKNLWKQFIKPYYIHQFFDFVFHTRRLSKKGKKEFMLCAQKTLDDAREAGVDPFGISLYINYRKYYANRVLPLILKMKFKAAKDARSMCHAIASLIQFAFYKIRTLTGK